MFGTKYYFKYCVLVDKKVFICLRTAGHLFKYLLLCKELSRASLRGTHTSKTHSVPLYIRNFGLNTNGY